MKDIMKTVRGLLVSVGVLSSVHMSPMTEGLKYARHSGHHRAARAETRYMVTPEFL